MLNVRRAELDRGRTMSDLGHPVLFLATADAARARVFYEDVLGLEFVADEYVALVFRVGGSMLRIQKVEQVHAAPYTALGWDVPDICAIVRQLREAEVTFERFDGMK